MEFTTLQLQILPSNVAVIAINLPDRKLNVLSSRVMTELDRAIDKIGGTQGIRGLIVTSGKPDSFIAGADIAEIQIIQYGPQVKAYEAAQLGKAVFAKLQRPGIRSVAAINGVCLGGGLELALACHERVAANTAQVGVPESLLGFIPAWGGTVRLTRLCGIQGALKLVTGGDSVDATAAWKQGIVSEVVEPAGLMERAEAIALGSEPARYNTPVMEKVNRWALEGNPAGRSILRQQASKMIKKRTRGKFPAPPAALKVIFKAATGPDEKAYDSESVAFSELAVGQVSKNLVGIYFAKEQSKKTSVATTGGTPIKKIGVIGAGQMGSGIAQAAALAGYDVVLIDIAQAAIDAGMKTIGELFASLTARRKLSERKAEEGLSRVKATTSYSDLAGCDLIIEAVVEKMQIKLSALSNAEKIVKNQDFIFASNTSSLSVSTMASVARKPANTVGIHFFNPVHRMPLVEVVRSKETSDSTVARAVEFGTKLKKTTVVVSDSPGFVVNAILAPYLRESIMLLEEGVPVADVDGALRDFGMGFPGQMGPLELLDTVGLDIAGEVIRVLYAALGERMSPPRILSWIEEQNQLIARQNELIRKQNEQTEIPASGGAEAQSEKPLMLGKKTGKGIYLWDANGKRGEVNPELITALAINPRKICRPEIQDRLALVMINEAARCLEKGVVSDPGQLDLAMIFGTGFPPYLGGPLRYADSLGLKVVAQKLEWLCKVAGENYQPCSLLLKKAAANEKFYPDPVAGEKLPI